MTKADAFDVERVGVNGWKKRKWRTEEVTQNCNGGKISRRVEVDGRGKIKRNMLSTITLSIFFFKNLSSTYCYGFTVALFTIIVFEINFKAWISIKKIQIQNPDLRWLSGNPDFPDHYCAYLPYTKTDSAGPTVKNYLDKKWKTCYTQSCIFVRRSIFVS